MKGLIRARLATADDLRFVCAAWFESYWKSTMRPLCLFEEYKAGQDARIRRLIEKSKATVVYAAEIPDEILGFSVIEPGILHYAYVKVAYRRQRIAESLVQAAGVKYYTHQTPLGRVFATHLGLLFNPYLLEDQCPKSNPKQP